MRVRPTLLSLSLGWSLCVVAASSFAQQGGPVTQVYTVTTSQSATYTNPSGALEPMPSTSVTFSVVLA